MKLLKKIGVLLLLFFMFNNLTNYSYSFDLKKLKEKIHQKKEQKDQTKQENIKDNKEVQIKDEEDYWLLIKDIEIDNQFFNMYNNVVDEKLKAYQEYLKAKNEEKRKQLEEKFKYLKLLKQQVNDIKNILKKNDFLYMWVIYLPANSNLVFFQYNWKLYFVPNFDSVVEYKNNEDKDIFNSEKYKILKKYSATKINKIKKSEEFNMLKEKLWLIDFDLVQDNITLLLSDWNTVLLYPIEAFKEAVKEQEGIDYNTNWLFVFFIPNNFWDTSIYRNKYMTGTIKLISSIFMVTGQNNIGINSIVNPIGYKEVLIPLRVVKKQQLIKVVEKQPWLLDLIVFIWILLGWWIMIWIGIKKLLNIYKDVE